MPLIISIEGGDQAGKKTQSSMLVKVLDSRGVRVSAFSFPDYTTPVGKVIKNVLNGKHTPIPQVIQTCLMSANRWEMFCYKSISVIKFSALQILDTCLRLIQTFQP